jgi:endoglucanase
MDSIKLLRKLTETPGPSGFEARIAGTVRELWQPLADTVTIDRVGSVIATKSGRGVKPRPRLLLAAHLDEIGLIVKKIINHDGYGFLQLSELGGVDVRHLVGQTAVVHGQRDLVGVIGALPIHMIPEERQRKAFGFQDLVVDVGLPQEDVAKLISVGDAITFRQPLRKLQKRIVTGKALDNRASVAAVTLCLENLQERFFAWDVIAVATAQEETRLLGAYTAAFREQPDAAIAIDVTFAKGAGLSDSTVTLGGGPCIQTSPSVHPGMKKALQDAAEAIEMKVETTASAYPGGTDAFGLQIARAGVPTALVSIPLRYMHTMVETVDADDVTRVGRLLAEFITGLDDKFLDKLAQEMMEE